MNSFSIASSLASVGFREPPSRQDTKSLSLGAFVPWWFVLFLLLRGARRRRGWGRGRRRPRLEIRLRDARELLDERDDPPDVVVRGAGAGKARHAGHVDAVLDDPEELGRL